MKIIGIQNLANINHPHFENKKAESNVQRQDYNCQYNPIYYMPSFKSKTTDKFTELFEQGLEEDLPQSKLNMLSRYIYKVKDEVTSDEDSFIGEGYFGSVYRINDDYVLKVNSLDSKKHKKEFKYNKEDKFKDMPYYYGRVLATFDNLSILRNANPKGNAIVAGRPSWKYDRDGIDYMLNTSLPAFANLPQSAYDNFANVLKLLNGGSTNTQHNTTRFSPDTRNPNNFMIVDNEIRFVDELTELHHHEKNDLYTMCAPFLGDPDLNNNYINTETINYTRKIFKKCVLASEEAELPLPCNAKNKSNLSKIMKMQKYKTKAKDFVDFLKSTREQEPDKEKRKQTIAEYLDNME